jgi:hypothetical protein
MLTVELADDGTGMDAQMLATAADPFTTTRTTRRVGLGLSLLKEAAEAAGGTMQVTSSPGKGTTVRATFRLSHVDRKPLGNMADTVTAIVAAAPALDITYRHTRDGRTVIFETKEVARRLQGAPLNSAGALSVIRTYLAEEEQSLAHHA